MAESNFERCLANTILFEGGYSDDPHDPGGMTMNGITQVEYDAWRRSKDLPKQWVRHLSQAERTAIYHQNYWLAAHCDQLPVGLDFCVFDAAVNSGIRRSQQWLAEMHPDTRDHEEIREYNDVRLDFLKGLRTWRYFGKGWEKRVALVERIAEEMFAQDQASAAQSQAPAGPNTSINVPGDASPSDPATSA